MQYYFVFFLSGVIKVSFSCFLQAFGRFVRDAYFV